MLRFVHAFSSYSVNDLAKAQQFYGQILNLDVTKDDDMGLLHVQLPGGAEVMLYPKPDHSAASFTVLNLMVADIESAVDELTIAGIVFEHYNNERIKTNDKGIAAGTPRIAWFKDPAGNILAVIEDSSTK